MDKPILTIAIPTYNRASCLDSSLSHILRQSQGYGSAVEVFVSNNNSSDNTEEVVSKYLSQGFAVRYVRNAENIGSDRNLLQCFKQACGKYVLVMGDDDILLDGALDKIITLLRSDDYGVVFLNSYGFVNDFVAEQPRARPPEGAAIFTSVDAFLRKTSYLLSFISVNVVNRERVDEGLLDQLMDSHLVQLGWVFSALFSSDRNIVVQDYCVAGRMFNSGGYKFCDVFALSFNEVFDIFAAWGIEKSKFDIITKKLLRKHYPAQIVRSRSNQLRLIQEDFFHKLYPLYKRYLSFWLFTVPAIFLPVPLCMFLYKTVKTIRDYTPFR